MGVGEGPGLWILESLTLLLPYPFVIGRLKFFPSSPAHCFSWSWTGSQQMQGGTVEVLEANKRNLHMKFHPTMLN